MNDTHRSRALAARLADLLHQEHAAMAEFLVALAEFDRGRGWEDLGYAGLFPFLHRQLGLSKAAAFFRMRAAQLLQRFPEIAGPLRDGRLCLTSVVELSKVLTPENRETVLPRFFHCSKQEAKAVSAELAPMETPPRRSIVTAVPAAAPIAVVAAAEFSSQSSKVRPGEPVCPEVVTPAPPPTPPVRDEAVPLTGTLSRLHVTVSREFLDKLEGARLALSHSRPGASLEDVLEAGLDLVLAKDAKKKACVTRPRPGRSPRVSGGESYIPAEIRRAVWKRDGGRCQWKVDCGGTCGSKLRAELDHVIPKGQGGATTVANLRVLCRAHNDLAARLAYGDKRIAQYKSPARDQSRLL